MRFAENFTCAVAKAKRSFAATKQCFNGTNLLLFLQQQILASETEQPDFFFFTTLFAFAGLNLLRVSVVSKNERQFTAAWMILSQLNCLTFLQRQSCHCKDPFLFAVRSCPYGTTFCRIESRILVATIKWLSASQTSLAFGCPWWRPRQLQGREEKQLFGI